MILCTEYDSIEEHEYDNEPVEDLGLDELTASPFTPLVELEEAVHLLVESAL